jgi:UDP-N-acetylglucosamine--N-acetylmuramyl-(pentapeptide) pyrophosphoryl-undecaprenol N-acetylglucosamine transferase
MSRTAGLIVAGGGTGGHVLAGIAIAEAWRGGGAPLGVSREVLFIGAVGGIEEKLVPKSGFPLEKLRIGSLNRVSWGRKLLTVFQLPLSFFRSAYLMWREKPHAVIGVGGYASGPVVLVSALLAPILKIKVAILEQNAAPGLTNRILSHFAHEVFLAFPVSDDVFRSSKKTVTGNPVRNQMQPMPSAHRKPFTVFIFGGSQGAQGINSLILNALPHLKDIHSELRWIHQTGEKEFQRVKQGYEAQGLNARVEPFIYDMAQCYSQASLVICRAGSSTLSELAMVRRAAVLIPFPFASDNHQELNARIFEKEGAARVFLQDKTPAEELAALIRAWVQDDREVVKMERRMEYFAKPDAAMDIVKRLSHESTPT